MRKRSRFDQRLASKGIVPAVRQPWRLKSEIWVPKCQPPWRPQKMAFAKRFLAVCRAATEQMGKGSQISSSQEEVCADSSASGVAPVAPVSTAPVYDCAALRVR